LITVDGRQASSKGWSMAEAADFAGSLGATDAVNFHGGGGTTFVLQGKVANSPSADAKGGKPGTVRRAVNALAVVPG
jgi:exopolysaccharide biosynthesis protein